MVIRMIYLKCCKVRGERGPRKESSSEMKTLGRLKLYFDTLGDNFFYLGRPDNRVWGTTLRRVREWRAGDPVQHLQNSF